MMRFGRKERKRGQTMTEYIIIVALIAIASIAIVTIFSNQIRALFSGSAQQLAGNESAEAEDLTDGAGDVTEREDLTDWTPAGGS